MGTIPKLNGTIMSVPNKLESLLRVDVSHDGWEHDIANTKKAFYCRGLNTFKRKILSKSTSINSNIDSWSRFIPHMVETIQSRQEWLDSPLLPNIENYSILQAKDAFSLNRKPVLLGKAIQSITLLEAVAKEILENTGDSIDPSIAYELVSIEAAISYIPGFNRPALKTGLAKSSDLKQQLLKHTGQRSLAVFFQMADRKNTVTHSLAVKTYEVLTQFPAFKSIGEPEFRFSKAQTISPSKDEIID
ncbi:MAG: hypothetical protein ACPGOY_09190 [Rhodospirillaceae bacterium]